MTDKRTLFKQKKQRNSQTLRVLASLLILVALGMTILLSPDDEALASAQKEEIFLAESNRCTRYFSAIEAKYDMPENILRAISTIESGRWSKSTVTPVTWPWTLNVDGKGHRFNSKEETIAALAKFEADGAKLIDVGCMQINLHFHPEAFPNHITALEPRFNIEYAASLLTKHYERTGDWKRAIARYHSGTPHRGSKYARKVVNMWDQINRELATGFDKNIPVPVTKVSMRSSKSTDIDG